MNTKSIRFILGWILNIEALLMLLPVGTAVFYREEEGVAYALVMALCAAIGALLTYIRLSAVYADRRDSVLCGRDV